MNIVDLSVQIGGVRLPNPLMTASGTFGYGHELLETFPVHRLGAVVSKGLTLQPREGNPRPRIAETRCGLLNSIGLENMGLQAYLDTVLPLLRERKVRVVLNVEGRSEAEFYALIERIEARKPDVVAVEVNVSCPNVDGGLQFGQDLPLLERLVRGMRERTSFPLWIKLTPSGVDVREEARAAEAGGADAVVVANTYPGMAVDVDRRAFLLPRGFGGLSGPAIHPMTLYWVHEVVGAVQIPVIAVGGVHDFASAVAYLLVGARAVQIGSALFVEPDLPYRILDRLPAYLRDQGVSSVEALVGSLRLDR